MKKNIVQDVIPNKKSIRNIELDSRSRSMGDIKKEIPKEIIKPKLSITREKEPVVTPKTEEPLVIKRPTFNPPPPETPVTYNYEYSKPKKPSKKILYSVLTLCAIIAYFGISFFFKRADIKLVPEQQSQKVDYTFTAKKDVLSGLSFQTVALSKEAEKAVPATGEEKVEAKASGTIVIYNNTDQVQKLIATTRFETPEGMVYRIKNAVSIPAKSIKDGKQVAGSIEALVEADKAGEAYNIGLKDFTVPGLKGDPKYTQIFGRSKTEMTGGFSGVRKIVSKDVLTKAESDLEEDLKKVVAQDIIPQIPANFVLYSSSIYYRFNPVVITTGSDGQAVLKKKVTATAMMFDKAVLSKEIVSKVLPQENPDLVTVSNLDGLNFVYTGGMIDPNSTNAIAFSLKGDANFVWIIDEIRLKNDLLGLSKKNAKNIIAKYSSVKEAWVETRPFWSSSIPKDPEKVSINTTLTP